MKSYPKKRGTKALIIGLDGVPYSLLNRYIIAGYMPNLSQILKEGYSLNRMYASIPDVSSTSWTSFMTGVNPGEHRIYGFMGLVPCSYSLYFPNFNDVSAPTIWDILGRTENGKSSTLSKRYSHKITKPLRSIVINIPQTYPARAMNGIITAGFVALDLKKATYPESAYDYLSSLEYIIDVDARKARDDKDLFISDINTAFERRKEAVMHFMKNEPWNLFIATITETDRLHHFFFDAAQDEGHPYHERFIEFYRGIDDFIGKLYGNFIDETNGEGLFMTMSDHGFTELKKEVYINNLLKEYGFLNIDESREFFDRIDYGTKAFAMDPARIYLNTIQRYPRGAVSGSESVSIVNELKDCLLSFKDTDGDNPIKEVFERDAIYNGPFTDAAPDLVCLASDGYDLKASLQKQSITGKEHFTGMHTRHNAHCILPEHIDLSKGLHIEDLASIILDYFVG